MNNLPQEGFPKDISNLLQLSLKDLEREIAVLRHMEKVRGELIDKQGYSMIPGS